MKICKENEINAFYFKLLHRIVVSKKELYYFRAKKDPNCNYCGQVESIEHTFIECHRTKTFFIVLCQISMKSILLTLCGIEMIFGKTLLTRFLLSTYKIT